MEYFENPYRLAAVTIDIDAEVPNPSDDIDRPRALLARCPEARETPLVSFEMPGSGAQLLVKDERARMGLGSFKALGAAYVIASDPNAREKTYVTASAGNHGLSVAAGARIFSAKSIIYIAETVPESFAERLRAEGAEVRREGAVYEDSMAAAERAAQAEGLVLLSDSSWPGYYKLPRKVMQGYLALMGEVFDQMPRPATHVFLQAGVGGLAAACGAAVRKVWGDNPKIVVVEPDAAPALASSIREGHLTTAPGPVSAMGRLDCKTPSIIALKGLARDANWFCTLTDAEVASQMEPLAEWGLATSPSGGAGLAAALLDEGRLGINQNSRVLCILSEGPA
ncbi:MAG: pyridoxal-phosphate dependent enzyme [Litoreibacter sp.]|nr:pyridoxal-phosphate dependent enzyme [Litoreibacter sp.]